MAAGDPALDRACAVLDGIAPGYLPPPLFAAIARLAVLPSVVVVPLFRRDGRVRVCLTRRAPDDPWYPGQLHPPGTVILADDQSLEAVFDRLLALELPTVAPAGPPVLVQAFFDQIARGRELALVHSLPIADPGRHLDSYDCDALPDDVIATDLPRLAAARRCFEGLE